MLWCVCVCVVFQLPFCGETSDREPGASSQRAEGSTKVKDDAIRALEVTVKVLEEAAEATRKKRRLVA